MCVCVCVYNIHAVSISDDNIFLLLPCAVSLSLSLSLAVLLRNAVPKLRPESCEVEGVTHCSIASHTAGSVVVFANSSDFMCFFMFTLLCIL